MTQPRRTNSVQDRRAGRAIWAGAALAIAVGTAGAETGGQVGCLIEAHHPVVGKKGRAKIYYIARWPISLAPRAADAEGAGTLEELIEIPEHAPEMGTPYRSAFETDEAVLIGHYVGLDKKCFTKLHGWAAREDLLEAGGSEAMRVGEMVKNNKELAERLRERYPAGKSLIDERSRILMRVLMRPERLTRPRLAPSELADENLTAAIGDTYFWRYVYDVHTDDEGRIWYLLGTHSKLTRRVTLTSTEQLLGERTSVRRLQGWVREKNVVPWPTNLVLELNAHKDAVRERFPGIAETPHCMDDAEGYAPGTIIEEVPREREDDDTAGTRAIAEELDIRVIAYESCSLWDDAFNKETKNGGGAEFLPAGLGKSTVRAHVQEIDKDKGWASVATLGSLTGTVSTGERNKARRAMLNVIRSISEIEMVLLIDATGSMVKEVQDVGLALEYLHYAMSKGGIGTIKTDDYATLRGNSGISASELEIEVKVSLVLFSDVNHKDTDEPMTSKMEYSELPRTGHIFKRLSLRTELPRIIKGINEAVEIVRKNEKVSGGAEATLYGLAEAIDDDTLWGDPMLGQQLIVLVTDEMPTKTEELDRHKLAEKYRQKTKTMYAASRQRAKEHGYEILGGEIDGTQHDFLWGSVIFTGGQELHGLMEMVKPLGIFHEDRVLSVNEERRKGVTEAEYALAADAIIGAINDEQAKIERMATMLERCAIDAAQCVEKRERGGGATGIRASKSEVERTIHALVERGLDPEMIIKEIENGLVEGYTRLKRREKRSTWRQAVMLNEDQMDSYAKMLRSLVYGLEARDENAICDSDEATLVRLVIFLREIAVEQPSNVDTASEIARKKRHMDTDEACATADAMLVDGMSGRIIDELNLPHILPVDSDGLFGIELDKLAGEISQVEVEKRIVQFIKRADCIQAMSPLGSWLLPEQALDPDEPEPENHCSAEAVEQKYHDWTVRVSYRYGGRYVFIPLELLP